MTFSEKSLHGSSAFCLQRFTENFHSFSHTFCAAEVPDGLYLNLRWLPFVFFYLSLNSPSNSGWKSCIICHIKEDQRVKTSASAVIGDCGIYPLQAVRIPKNHSFLRYQAIKLYIDDVTGADSSQFYIEKVYEIQLYLLPEEN